MRKAILACCLLLAGCGDSYDRRNWKRRTIWARIRRRWGARRVLTIGKRGPLPALSLKG